MCLTGHRIGKQTIGWIWLVCVLFLRVWMLFGSKTEKHWLLINKWNKMSSMTITGNSHSKHVWTTLNNLRRWCERMYVHEWLCCWLRSMRNKAKFIFSYITTTTTDIDTRDLLNWWWVPYQLTTNSAFFYYIGHIGIHAHTHTHTVTVTVTDIGLLMMVCMFWWWWWCISCIIYKSDSM